jgi:hypothetical protein
MIAPEVDHSRRECQKPCWRCSRLSCMVKNHDRGRRSSRSGRSAQHWLAKPLA